MQENEFEKRVKQQMDEFTLIPNNDVWNKVEARIKNEKRRRLLFFWMFTGCLLIGITTFYIVGYKGENDILKASVNTASIEKQTNAKAGSLNGKTGITSNTTEQSKADATEVRGRKMTIIKKLDYGDQKIYLSKNYSRTKNANSSKTTTSEADINFKKDLAVIDNNSENIFSKKPDKTEPQRLEIEERLAKDSIAQSLVKQETSISKATDTASAAIKKVTNKKTKKFQFGITAFAGASDNVNGVRVFAAKSIMDQYAYSSAPSGVSGSAQPLSKLQYTSAPSFGIGVFIKKNVSKRSAFSVGVNYHYLSAKSQIGNRKDTVLNIDDTALQISTHIHSIFQPGRSVNYVNQYHLLQLPFNVELQLNRTINKPIIFSIGLTPSVLVSSQALYLNRYNRLYYEEKRQFKNFLLFGQTAALFTIANSKNHQAAIGPTFQYNFNSFSKWQTNTHQHLLFYGLKTNITFK